MVCTIPSRMPRLFRLVKPFVFLKGKWQKCRWLLNHHVTILQGAVTTTCISITLHLKNPKNDMEFPLGNGIDYVFTVIKPYQKNFPDIPKDLVFNRFC